MGHTIASVDNEASCTGGRVEGQNILVASAKSVDLEGLKHNLDHLFTVLLGVAGHLRQAHVTSFVRRDAELVIEGVVPHLLHVFPGLDYACGNWVADI